MPNEQKAEREAALTKARDLAKNPGNYIRATSYGAAKYVKKKTMTKKPEKSLPPLLGWTLMRTKSGRKNHWMVTTCS